MLFGVSIVLKLKLSKEIKLSEVDGFIGYLLFFFGSVIPGHVSARFFCVSTKEISLLQTSVRDIRNLIVPNECKGT